MDQQTTRALPERQRVTDDAETIASIGERMRELRRAKRVTLARIATETGLSIGHLSQVERGISVPSIRHLQLIATALGVKIGWFFDGPDVASAAERGIIVRADRRKKLNYSGLGLTDYLLSPNLSGKLELLLCELDPGAESGTDYYSHEGEEAGIIIEGALELWVGDNRYLLVAGDSFTFASVTPHRYRNPGRSLTRIVWVITPPSF